MLDAMRYFVRSFSGDHSQSTKLTQVETTAAAYKSREAASLSIANASGDALRREETPSAISGSYTMPAPRVTPSTVNSATARPCPTPRATTSMLSGPGGICSRTTVPTNVIQSAASMSNFLFVNEFRATIRASTIQRPAEQAQGICVVFLAEAQEAARRRHPSAIMDGMPNSRSS